MSVGSVFLLLSFLLFVLLWGGLTLIPRAEMAAAALAVLGVLLAGIPLPPWPRA